MLHNHFGKILSLLMLFQIVILSGCQEESVRIIEPPAEKTFTSDALLADLITRVSLHDGSDDNILADGSCFSFKLPLTITVNGKEIVIESQDDYALVEFILDEFDDDDDEIQFHFPVVVILADYSEVSITNAEQLEDYIDSCEVGGFDDDIECIDFVFPIQFSTYDTNNQLSDVVIINNDQELFEFLRDMDDDILLSLQFPVTLILFDGSEVTVNNNSELLQLIDDSDEDCDEDDDEDDDNSTDLSELRAVLLSGNWIITSFINEGDETTLYNGWVFRFQSNGTLTASKDDVTENGQWSIEIDDNIFELHILFDTDTLLEELAEDWDVASFTSLRIELTDTDEENNNSLVFEKL